MPRVPPNNTDAEKALIGACMLSRDAMEITANLVTPYDFYSPAHSTIYAQMIELWNDGKPLDPVSICDGLQKNGKLSSVGGPQTLLTIQKDTPATSNAKRYAAIVVEMSTYRRAIRIASELSERCYDMDGDPTDLMEEATAAFSTAGVKIGDIPADLWQLDEFLSRPDAERPEWCIPGIIRVGWRVIVVAGEGVGKTTYSRMMAMAAAQGIHPLRSTPIPPCRSLMVDLENPEDSILDSCNVIKEQVLAEAQDYNPERAWLWHRPSGIDLRNRTDRITFESVIAHVRPKLVCIGPLYKAYEVHARENDEIAAREVMSVLDDLRTRYKFGLLMEHHAPKKSGGSKREMMPYGTSLWLRWPEMGIALEPEGQGLDTLLVGRWRGDRLENDWPIKLHRSLTWPWQGEFENVSSYKPQADSAPVVYEADEDYIDDYDYGTDIPF